MSICKSFFSCFEAYVASRVRKYSLRSVGLVLDGQLTFEYFLERNNRLCACGVELLEMPLDDLKKMVVVARHDFCEQIIVTRREMAFHHLGDFLELGYYLVEFCGVGEKYSYCLL